MKCIGIRLAGMDTSIHSVIKDSTDVGNGCIRRRGLDSSNWHKMQHTGLGGFLLKR